MMKTGIYVGYAKAPLKVYILRSTATRHLVVPKASWDVREAMYRGTLSYVERELERRHSEYFQKYLTKMLGFGNADAWATDRCGMWVTHERVFNQKEVGE